MNLVFIGTSIDWNIPEDFVLHEDFVDVSCLFQSGDFQEERIGAGGDNGEAEKKCVFCVCAHSTVNTFYRLYVVVYRDVGVTRIKSGGIFILCSGRTVNRYNA